MRGRPILGGTAGVFLGLFVAYDLFLFRVIASDSPAFEVLPVVSMVAGIALGFWAPLRRRH